MSLSKVSKIGISWAFICAGGIYAFYLSKTSIVQRRYENMKARQRMRESNTGDYEPSYRKFSTVPQQ